MNPDDMPAQRYKGDFITRRLIIQWMNEWNDGGNSSVPQFEWNEGLSIENSDIRIEFVHGK